MLEHFGTLCELPEDEEEDFYEWEARKNRERLLFEQEMKKEEHER